MTDRPDTVVLVRGLWLTPRAWEGWAERYTRRGMRVLAPAWPGLEAGVEALDADPTAIGELTVPAIVRHYEATLDGLGARPIVMGLDPVTTVSREDWLP